MFRAYGPDTTWAFVPSVDPDPPTDPKRKAGLLMLLSPATQKHDGKNTGNHKDTKKQKRDTIENQKNQATQLRKDREVIKKIPTKIYEYAVMTRTIPARTIDSHRYKMARFY